eukprot:CAMPEP_0168332758 /NCGR_PEP_ID=MMETSP0213-20121227/9156_1 /TAXON_ID=151035 /ORGANISM="Euplotes harpa, Strain FSP1.4" /LENGTH=100 /DNA_ID=CAMNT_0008336859 /DNA_START=113 /DNA_END=415 /DNA_ORIENTATION=+
MTAGSESDTISGHFKNIQELKGMKLSNYLLQLDSLQELTTQVSCVGNEDCSSCLGDSNKVSKESVSLSTFSDCSDECVSPQIQIITDLDQKTIPKTHRYE